MKKFFIISCLFMIATCLSAQKKYLTAISYGSYIALSGDIPEGINPDYNSSDFGMKSDLPTSLWIGDMLNLLSEKGFTVEKMNTVYNGDRVFYNYLLSRESADPSPASSIQRVQADADGEAREVARYNLQGLPVSRNEKGIQIIVFSNYTTKAVIVE